MQIWWNSMYREYRDTDGHAGGITESDGCTYLSHIAASMRGMLVTSSHTRPVPSHLSTCARVHRALQWDMPCVVRMPSRARLFLLPLSLLPSPFPFPFRSLSPFFLLSFFLHAIRTRSRCQRGIRMKTKKGWSELARRQKACSFLRNDKWLRVIFHGPRHVRGEDMWSTRVDLGLWRIRVLEINREDYSFEYRNQRRYVSLIVTACTIFIFARCFFF